MKSIKLEIKWAIVFTIMMLLWMYFEKTAGLHDVHIDQHAIYTNLVIIPAVLVYVLALLDKRKNYFNGKMTYMQGFISGLIISVFIAILTPLSQWITVTYISPEYFENAIHYTVSNNKMSSEEAVAYFNLNNYIVQSSIFAPIMGILTSAIVAIFTKKK